MKYLLSLKFRRHISALARFRCSNHDFEIEIGRRNKVLNSERYYTYCLQFNQVYVEDALYVLLVCPRYESVRVDCESTIYT